MSRTYTYGVIPSHLDFLPTPTVIGLLCDEFIQSGIVSLENLTVLLQQGYRSYEPGR